MLKFRNQELEKFKHLLQVILADLQDLNAFCHGDSIQIDDALLKSLFINEVPARWSEASFLSDKSLSYWMLDLIQRVTFLSDWDDPDRVHFPMGYFMSPQSFIFAVKQHFARSSDISIDEIGFKFQLCKKEHEEKKDRIYLSGLKI